MIAAPKQSLYLQMMLVVAGWRAGAAAWMTGLPFWPDVVRFSQKIGVPVTAIAHWALRTMPWLRKAEWLLEVETLTKRHPVAIAFSICYVAWSGLMPTLYGHIATDRTLYPVLAAISGFNPFLGLLCGAAFGVADFAQKLVWNDIFQDAHTPQGRLSMNYWGAMAGYLIAYSSTMTMGMLPGIASRVSRLAMRKTLQTFFYRRSAAAADGAVPLNGWRIYVRQRPGNIPELAMAGSPPDSSWTLKAGPYSESECWSRISDLDASRQYDATVFPVDRNKFARPAAKPATPYAAYRPSPIPAPLEQVDPLKSPWTQIDPRRCATAEGTYPMPEMVAGFFGGALAAAVTMALIAPKLEAGIFYLRPNADDSCHKLEVEKYLQGNSPIGGLGGGIGGLGPNVTPPPRPPGTPPAGSGPPAVPDPAAFVDRYNVVNSKVVQDPALTARLKTVLDGFHQTGKMDLGELTSIEQAQDAIRQQTIASADAGNEQNLAANQAWIAAQRVQQQARDDAAAAVQAGLRRQYDGAIQQASGLRPGFDGSAAAMALANDPKYSGVIRPDGTIDPAALRTMQGDLLGATQKTDSDQAVLANATATAANKTVTNFRDGAILAASSVVGGTLLSAGCSALSVAAAMGAGSSGITAYSDGKDLGGTAAAALTGGLTGVFLGGTGALLANCGFNPAAAGLGLLGTVSGLQGLYNGTGFLKGFGSGVGSGIVGMAFVGVGGQIGNALGLVPTAPMAAPAPEPIPLGPKVRVSVDSPSASPLTDNWGGAMPAKPPAPAAPPPDLSLPRPYTSPDGANWGQDIVPPPRATPNPDFTQPGGFVSPKSDSWGGQRPAPPYEPAPPAPDLSLPRQNISPDGENWRTQPKPPAPPDPPAPEWWQKPHLEPEPYVPPKAFPLEPEPRGWIGNRGDLGPGNDFPGSRFPYNQPRSWTPPVPEPGPRPFVSPELGWPGEPTTPAPPAPRPPDIGTTPYKSADAGSWPDAPPPRVPATPPSPVPPAPETPASPPPAPETPASPAPAAAGSGPDAPPPRVPAAPPSPVPPAPETPSTPVTPAPETPASPAPAAAPPAEPPISGEPDTSSPYPKGLNPHTVTPEQADRIAAVQRNNDIEKLATHPAESLKQSEDFFRSHGDPETADMVSDAIKRKAYNEQLDQHTNRSLEDLRNSEAAARQAGDNQTADLLRDAATRKMQLPPLTPEQQALMVNRLANDPGLVDRASYQNLENQWHERGQEEIADLYKRAWAQKSAMANRPNPDSFDPPVGGGGGFGRPIPRPPAPTPGLPGASTLTGQPLQHGTGTETGMEVPSAHAEPHSEPQHEAGPGDLTDGHIEVPAAHHEAGPADPAPEPPPAPEDPKSPAKQTEAKPVDGSDHGDDGWSPEALSRMKNHVVRVRSNDGKYDRVFDPSAVDTAPKGKEAWVLSDNQGNVQDVKFGPAVRSVDKPGLRARIEADYAKTASRNRSL